MQHNARARRQKPPLAPREAWTSAVQATQTASPTGRADAAGSSRARPHTHPGARRGQPELLLGQETGAVKALPLRDPRISRQ